MFYGEELHNSSTIRKQNFQFFKYWPFMRAKMHDKYVKSMCVCVLVLQGDPYIVYFRIFKHLEAHMVRNK